MNDLDLMAMENSEISTWDFPSVKDKLVLSLQEYKGIVYTDETIKEAKEDKKKIKSQIKLIEDARKAFKARCMEPYNTIEPQIKELTELLKEQESEIDTSIKSHDEKLEDEKRDLIHSFYLKKAVPLGNLADKLFDRILNPRWLKVSVKKKAYEEEVLTAISRTAMELAVIQELNSPFSDDLFEKYIGGSSLEEVKAYNDTMLRSAARAGLTRDSEDAAAEKSVYYKIPTEKQDGTHVIIHGSEKQLTQVFDFMKAIGVKYELSE